MWTYLRRQTLTARSSLVQRQRSAVPYNSVISRCFASSDFRSGDGSSGGKNGSGLNRKNNNSRDGRNRPPHNHRDHSGNRRGSNNNKKTNFSEKFLQPAAEGKLKKHQSGIPRLANRKHKGHAVRGADPLLESEAEEMMGFDDDYTMEDDFVAVGWKQTRHESARPSQKTGTIDAGSKLEDLNPEEYKEVMEFIDIYEAMAYMPDREDYYWNESDYDSVDYAKKEAMFDKLKQEATRDADGNLVVEVDDETFAAMESWKADDDRISSGGDNNKASKQRQPNPQDQGIEFIMDAMGIKGSDKPPNPETYDVVTPLNLKGPSVSDFVESMMEHPTKFGQIKFDFPHPESKREPVPDLPPRRRNPPPEFVEASSRFLYVWGLPLLMMDGKPGDLGNPVHAMEIQKHVATLFDVQPEAVYASTLTSAFVGFRSAADRQFALTVGPMHKIIHSPVTISKYSPKEDDKKSFAAKEMDSVVLLDNLPEGHTPSSLARVLFPPDGEVGSIYGNLKPEDFKMLTSHSAALRFESAELADNAVASAIVEDRLTEFGQHRVRYTKARRELVYTGKHTGPMGMDPEKVLGTQLIVDGDVPTKNFFLSHASTLHLRNLDPFISKKDISDFFQSCCILPRDSRGSVEFVTCYEGIPTGKAYVGFDEHGEAEAAMSLCETNGRLTGLGDNKIIMKRVKEATKIAREKRSAREEEELLDNLDNWEQFVDPEDLQELFDAGISKEALDEALRAIRYQNPTFSSLDQAIRTESMNPEKEAGGMYREMVQTYVSALKDCISTPDNPGPIYESLFLPDEEVDTEIFEDEPLRQEELKKRREVP